MALDVKISYPSPVQAPRPVGAALAPTFVVNAKTNEATGSLQELLENPGDPTKPVPGAIGRRSFVVRLSDAQLRTMFNIIMSAAQEQGILVPGSTPLVTLE